MQELTCVPLSLHAWIHSAYVQSWVLNRLWKLSPILSGSATPRNFLISFSSSGTWAKSFLPSKHNAIIKARQRRHHHLSWKPAVVISAWQRRIVAIVPLWAGCRINTVSVISQMPRAPKLSVGWLEICLIHHRLWHISLQLIFILFYCFGKLGWSQLFLKVHNHFHVVVGLLLQFSQCSMKQGRQQPPLASSWPSEYPPIGIIASYKRS